MLMLIYSECRVSSRRAEPIRERTFKRARKTTNQVYAPRALRRRHAAASNLSLARPRSMQIFRQHPPRVSLVSQKQIVTRGGSPPSARAPLVDRISFLPLFIPRGYNFHFATSIFLKRGGEKFIFEPAICDLGGTEREGSYFRSYSRDAPVTEIVGRSII